MKFLKRTLVALIATGFVLAWSAPAQAGTENCSTGWSCVWEHKVYEGKVGAVTLNKNVVPYVSNMGSSAAANGQTCRSTRFYETWSVWNQNVSGSYFTLDSKVLVGSNYRDPNLSNGAGYDGVGQNWEDRVSGIWHVKC